MILMKRRCAIRRTAVVIFSMLLCFTAFSASIKPAFKSDSGFFWDSDRLFKGCGVFIEMKCTGVDGFLSVELFSEHTGGIKGEIGGISILKSVLNSRRDELSEFLEDNLSGRNVKVSNPGYYDVDDLRNYITSDENPELLIWFDTEDGGEILWNLAMILNGYAQVTVGSDLMAPYIRVCGCQ